MTETLQVFSFDVTVSTHNLLRQGITEATLLNGERHSRVVVAAATFEDAQLLAGQMGCLVPIRELAGRPCRIASDHLLARSVARNEAPPSDAPEGEHPMCTGTYLRI